MSPLEGPLWLARNLLKLIQQVRDQRTRFEQVHLWPVALAQVRLQVVQVLESLKVCLVEQITPDGVIVEGSLVFADPVDTLEGLQ